MAGIEDRRFREALRPDFEAPRLARRALNGLRPLVDPGRFDELRLLVSELVSNCVRHAGLGEEDQIEVKVELRRDDMRVEVSDGGPGFDAAALSDSQQGFGLLILDRLSSEWGAYRGERSHVWFEMPRRNGG